MRVERDFLHSRKCSRQRSKNDFGAQLGETKSDAATCDAKQHTLRQQLAHHPERAGSQRGADGKFACPASGAREKQVGNIGARNQENKADGTEQNQQDSPNISDHVRLKGHQGDTGAFVGFRIGGCKVLSYAIHIRARLFDADAGFQPSDGICSHADAPVAKRRIVPLANRNKNVRRAKPGNSSGGNTYDRVDFAVQRDAPSQNLGRGSKFALPDSVTEDGHRARAGYVLLRPKVTAKQRPEAQSREKFRRNHVRVQPFRLSHAGHVEIVRPNGA